MLVGSCSSKFQDLLVRRFSTSAASRAIFLRLSCIPNFFTRIIIIAIPSSSSSYHASLYDPGERSGSLESESLRQGRAHSNRRTNTACAQLIIIVYTTNVSLKDNGHREAVWGLLCCPGSS